MGVSVTPQGYLVIRDHLDVLEIKDLLEEMDEMGVTETLVHLDNLEIEANLGKMVCLEPKDQWEKKVRVEVQAHLEFQDIRDHQENKEILECLVLKAQGEDLLEDLEKLEILVNPVNLE